MHENEWIWTWLDLKSCLLLCIWIQREKLTWPKHICDGLIKTANLTIIHTQPALNETQRPTSWRMMTISRRHFLHTIKVSFQARLHFSLGEQITLLTSAMHLYLTGRAETAISCCCYSANATGVSTPDKNISWENLTMCSNPHWNYSNCFQRQTHVSLLPFHCNHQACSEKANAFSAALDLCPTSALHYATSTASEHGLQHTDPPPTNRKNSIMEALYHGKQEFTCSSEITAFNVLWSCLNV